MFKFSLLLIFALNLLIGNHLGQQSHATTASAPIKMVLPVPIYSTTFKTELEKIVEEYNQLPTSKTPVQLIWRGKDFSSIQELITASLAETPPDLATIEMGEIDSADEAFVAKPIPAAQARNILKGVDSSFRKQSLNQKGKLISLPFQRTVPILVANQEKLFRHYLNPHKFPKDWKKLNHWASRLTTGAGNSNKITLSFQGSRGLWLFEALVGQPLWKTRKRKVTLDPKLVAPIQSLKKYLEQYRIEDTDRSWEKAIQIFINQDASLLFTSSDVLSHISTQVDFRWSADALPSINKRMIATGSQIVVPRPSPAVWAFLEYLYRPKIAARWASAGSFIPLSKKWKKTKVWKKGLGRPGSPLKILGELSVQTQRRNGSDIVRIRSQWQKILPKIIQQTNRTQELEKTLKRLETSLHH